MEISNKYGKEGAIMETGYSTWSVEGEDLQQRFINTELLLMKAIVTFNNKYLDNKITIATWYEMLDAGPHFALPQDWYFGILYRDWTEKIGYNDLANVIEGYGCENA